VKDVWECGCEECGGDVDMKGVGVCGCDGWAYGNVGTDSVQVEHWCMDVWGWI